MIKIRDTGRQKIFVLGEWVDVKGDATLKVEWFYIDGVFGVPKPGQSETGPDPEPKTDEAKPEETPSDSDLTQTVRSETVISSDQTRRKSSGLTRRKPSDNNIEENREENIAVNVNGDKKSEKGTGDIIRALTALDIDPTHGGLITETIVQELGDHKSKLFYHLIASRIPEDVIMGAISSVKNDGARNRGAVFTHKMRQYAEEKLGGRELVQEELQMRSLDLAATFSAQSDVYRKRDTEADTS